MSGGAGMFAWNRSQDSCSRSECRPKPFTAASSPGKRSAMATGSAVVEREREGLPVALEVFYGEGHGLRLASNIHRALRTELSFYTQVWGLESPEEDPVVVHVENLTH